MLVHLGMNGITEAHIGPPYKIVRFGYSILSPMKQQKSTFNSYNLFPALNLIQNMVNALFIVHILRFPTSRWARKNMLEEWTEASCVGGFQIRWLQSIWLSVYQLQTKVFNEFKRGWNLHPLSCRSFSVHPVHSKQGTAIFHCPGI